MNETFSSVKNKMFIAMPGDTGRNSGMDARTTLHPGDDPFDRYHHVTDAERVAATRLVPNPAWIRYCGADGHVTERVIEVGAIHPYDGATYLVSYCRLRGEARTFRADRLLAVARPETGEPVPVLAWLAGAGAWSPPIAPLPLSPAAPRGLPSSAAPKKRHIVRNVAWGLTGIVAALIAVAWLAPSPHGDGWHRAGGLVDGLQTQFVVVDTAHQVSADAYRAAIASQCSAGASCEIAFFPNDAAVPSYTRAADFFGHGGYGPLTVLAIYSRNAGTGLDRLLWNCRLVAGHAANDCMASR